MASMDVKRMNVGEKKYRFLKKSQVILECCEPIFAQPLWPLCPHLPWEQSYLTPPWLPLCKTPTCYRGAQHSVLRGRHCYCYPFTDEQTEAGHCLRWESWPLGQGCRVLALDHVMRLSFGGTKIVHMKYVARCLVSRTAG